MKDEFNHVLEEYSNKQEYDFIEEKQDDPEEFFNRITLKSKNDKEEKNYDTTKSNDSSKVSSQGSTATSNGAVFHGVSAIGTAVTMTACIAIAEAGIYSNDIDRNVVVSNNYIDSKEGQVPKEIFAIEEYKETEQTEIIEEVQEISEVKENEKFEVSSHSYTGTYDGQEHGGYILNVPEGSVITYGERKDNCNMINMPKYKDVGEYTVYYKLEKEGYETYIGSFIVKIDKKIVPAPYPSSKPLIYNGEEQSIKLNDNEGYTYSGVLSAKDAGSYKVKLKLLDTKNYQWSDGNTDDKIITWNIEPRELSIDWQDENQFIYNGEKHVIYVTLGNVIPGDFLNFTVKGNKASESGTYNAEVISFGGVGAENYVLPKEKNYVWSIVEDNNSNLEECKNLREN